MSPAGGVRALDSTSPPAEAPAAGGGRDPLAVKLDGLAAGSPWTLAILAGGGIVCVAVLGVNLATGLLGAALELVFLVYFARHFAFVSSALRSAGVDVSGPAVGVTDHPPVTVLVACKDEASVVEGLVSSLLGLDYPRARIQVIVVDDGSTDGTAELLDGYAQRLLVLHRSGPGGKSAALNAGLVRATGEIIVVFDADHQPNPDVITRVVRHFADPLVGCVQGRCEINNPDDSLISRVVAIDYRSGYLVNEYGRQALFSLPAYGGANCAVRSALLRQLGGWNERSVTEDTDLTMRVILSGYRVRFDVTAVDREEAVVTMRRYWRQRHRWARGHQQVWRDYRSAVLSSPRLSAGEKAETCLFLFGFHVPVLSGAGLAVLGLWVFGLARPFALVNPYALWTLLFLGPLLELGGGLLIARAPRHEALSLVWFVPMFFVSVAVATTAWFGGVFGRSYTWVKTQRRLDDTRVAVAVPVGR